jgi:hypothetical protein
MARGYKVLHITPADNHHGTWLQGAAHHTCRVTMAHGYTVWHLTRADSPWHMVTRCCTSHLQSPWHMVTRCCTSHLQSHNGTWLQGAAHGTCRFSLWHCLFCPTVAHRLASRCGRNWFQVSWATTIRRTQELQVNNNVCKTYILRY